MGQPGWPASWVLSKRDPVAQKVDCAQGTPAEVAPHPHHSTALTCTHMHVHTNAE